MYRRLLSVDKNQVLIFIFAIAVGLVISFPHLYGIYKQGASYTPFKITDKLQYMRDETYLYAAQARQILQGHIRGDAYTWEYRDNPSPFVSEVVSIIPISILSLILGSVEYALIASDFIFPIALFLIIVWGLKKFKVDNTLAILSATAVIIVPNLSSLLPYVSKGGVLLTGTTSDPLIFSRTPHPQISIIFLFLTLFLTAKVIANPKKYLVYIWSLVLGISIYSSLFVASTIYLSMILLSPLLMKKFGNKLIFTSFAIVFVIVLPWIINTVQFQNFIKDSDFFTRITYEKSLLFPRQIRYIVISLLFLRLYKHSLALVVLIFAVSAGLLMDGHQLLLGRSIDADHWITRVIAPVATLSLTLIVGYVFTKLIPKYSRLVFFMITIVIISFGMIRQLNWIDSHREDLLARPSFFEIVDEIKSKTDKTDVIGSLSPNINYYLTGITGRRVYLAPADRTLASTKEQLQRVCDLTKLSKDFSEEDLSKILQYAVGYKDWAKSEQDYIWSSIKKCSGDEKVIKNKLDYYIEYKDNQLFINKIN